MAWLNFGLPLDEAWEVENHARAIRDCDDLDRLRFMAEQLFRAWAQQSDIAAQLVSQLAEAEGQLAELGVIDDPGEEYLQWARELYPDASRAEHRRSA
jgi:hypothetical protein